MMEIRSRKGLSKASYVASDGCRLQFGFDCYHEKDLNVSSDSDFSVDCPPNLRSALLESNTQLDEDEIQDALSDCHGEEPPPPNEAGMPSKKAASFASLADLQSLSQFGDMTCPWPLDEIKLTPQDIANGIDRKCRIIFPTGFILFNIIYWLILYF